MRTIMMSLVLAAMSGCATVGGGVNTTFYRVNADDCGQTAPVPNNIQMFKGSMPSPGSALATDEQMERLIMEGQKATPGGHRVRIVGEPEVTIVSARWSK